jgi:hypothetical protein
MQLVRVRRKDGTSYLAQVVSSNPGYRVQRLEHAAFGAVTRREYALWQVGAVGAVGLLFGYLLGKGA